MFLITGLWHAVQLTFATVWHYVTAAPWWLWIPIATLLVVAFILAALPSRGDSR